jgi:hypothetical protein
MATQPSNSKIVAVCTQRIRALGAYADGRATFAINGRKLSRADVVALYQRCLDERAAVAKLRAEVLAKLGTLAQLEAERAEADRSLKAWVRDEFGIESKEAIELGFPAPKKGRLTVEQKASAVARAKATRKARYTMGRRQRAGIKGSVAGSAESAGGAAAAASEGAGKGAAGAESGEGGAS